MRKRASWVPSWVDSLGTVVWISDPEGRISYFNSHAEALLGLDARAVIGRPCRSVIGGTDARGARHCRPACPVPRLARRHEEIAPLLLRVAGTGHEPHWVDVLVIPVTAPDSSGPWLVHCGLRVDRARRIEAYLERVAARSSPHQAAPPPPLVALSHREREILDLLTQDRDLQSIADTMHVSYVTVRNHVQHILGKLGAHSIAEAVAQRLTLDED